MPVYYVKERECTAISQEDPVTSQEDPEKYNRFRSGSQGGEKEPLTSGLNPENNHRGGKYSVVTLFLTQKTHFLRKQNINLRFPLANVVHSE